uniref:FCP1 homology domain-containing protein n=1 Tax=Corvus moneduloides TaxID=1196302 RepID=A0A8C3GS49_CORMO
MQRPSPSLCDGAGGALLGTPCVTGRGSHGSVSPPRHCLSQSDCVCSQGCYWKDLTCLGRDLAKTVALDHTMQGFPAQDEELLRLIPVLAQLGQAVGCGHGDREGTAALGTAIPYPISPCAGGRAPRDPAALPALPAAH